MRGSIVQKKNGRYYVVTHQKKPNGQWGQVGHGGYRTKREAQAALREVLTSLDRGTYVERTNLTLGSYLQVHWLPSIRSAVRPSTFSSYEHNIANHVIPRLGDVPLQKLTPSRLNAFYADLLSGGRLNGPGGGLSPKTVRYIHTTLHKAMNDAIDDSLITLNPAGRAKPPKPRAAKGKEMHVWTAAELRRFLDYVATDRLSAAWMLAASTGMRRGELLGLRWCDLDLDAGRASISQTSISVNYEIQVSDTKTGRGTRVVDLDPRTVSALRAHRRLQAGERLACGPAWTETRRVFTREDGSPIHPDRLTQSFQRLSKDAGLPRIRLHDLRHTHATLALQAGVAPKVICDRLGHATVAFTMDVYAHAIPAMQAEAAERVAALVWG